MEQQRLLREAPAYLVGEASHRFADLLVVVQALQLVDRLLARDVVGRWTEILEALAEH